MIRVVGSEIYAVEDDGRRRAWFDDYFLYARSVRPVRAQLTPFANLLCVEFFNIPSKQLPERSSKGGRKDGSCTDTSQIQICGPEQRST